MAMQGVLRPGFMQLRVLDMAAAEKHYVDIVGLEKVGTDAQGRVYLKAWDEFDHHSVILREADSAGMDLISFKVESEEKLQEFEARIRQRGMAMEQVPAGEQPGVGRRVAVTLPSGHRLDLYAEIERAEQHPKLCNPNVWIGGEPPRGMGATRFDHALLYGPNIDETVAFFTEVLDFSVPEKVETEDGYLAVWLTCSTKPHDLAFVKHAEPGKLHHIAFFLESWYDVGKAADIITCNDVSIDIGPTRHGITRGQTIYFFDPSGNRNEVYAGGYIYYPDNPTRFWEAEQLGKGIFYYERKLNDAFLSVLT